MSDYINTIDSMGDENAAIALVTGTLEEYYDNVITSLGTYAFAGSPKLTIVDLPNVTSIKANAFYECPLLETINLPSLTGSGTFTDSYSKCTALKTLNLGDFKYTTNSPTFTGCASLETVPDCMSELTFIGANVFNGCTSLSDISVLTKVTGISVNGFADCESITDISIFNKCTYVGSSAFSGCTGITTADFPLAVDATNAGYKGDKIYCNCTSLQRISMPLITKLLNSACYGCTALVDVNMPSVTYIDASAFQGCSSLTIDGLVLGDVTYIGNNAFHGCEALTNVSFPYVTSMGVDAFARCFLLEVVKMESVTEIPAETFLHCHSLKAVVIGKSDSTKVCTLKATSAFANSYCILNTIGRRTPTEDYPDYGYIYVADSLVDDYKAATNWSQYADAIKPLSELPKEYQ